MTDGIEVVFAIVPPIIGMIINAIKSRERSKDISRLMKVCKDDLSDQLNSLFKTITNHFGGEVDRLITNIYRNQESFNIDDFSIRELNLGLTTKKLSEIQKTMTFIKRLKFALRKIKIFRSIFLFILVLGAGIGIGILYDPDLVPNIFTFIVATISVLSLLLYFCDMVLVNNLMDEVRGQYEV